MSTCGGCSSEQVLSILGSERPSAPEDLLPWVYERLRNYARFMLRSERESFTLGPTDVLHAAYLRICGSPFTTFEGRQHFFRTAAQAVRQVLLDHVRRRTSAKRGGGSETIPLPDLQIPAPMKAKDIVALNELLTDLAEADPFRARIVNLRYFGGLRMDEIALVLGASKSTVERGYRSATSWLASQLRVG